MPKGRGSAAASPTHAPSIHPRGDRPYHPPLDWGSVYSDQLFANTACYMRLRHAVEWCEALPALSAAASPSKHGLHGLRRIATNDLDEHIEVQTSDIDHSPVYLPHYLAALPPDIFEVSLVSMHCGAPRPAQRRPIRVCRHTAGS